MKSRFVIKRMLVLGFLFALLPMLPSNSPSASAAHSSQGAGYSCVINLLTNSSTCASPAISFVAAPSGGTAVPPVGGRTVAKITFGPSTGVSSATFNVLYYQTPVGWTVDIGDSITNDGYGGDATTQEYCAETQVLNQGLMVYANVFALPGNLDITTLSNVASTGNVLSLTVRNQQLQWLTANGHQGLLSSKFLYGLAGQADASYGGPNYDIYAAFNRVITGRYDRNGQGVSQVTITLN